MRRTHWILTAMALLSLANTGCTLFSRDPEVRLEQALIDSEHSGALQDEMPDTTHDRPVHLTPYIVHGGIGPGSSF